MSDGKKAQLHQLLAVEVARETSAKGAIERFVMLCSRLADRFTGHHKTLKMFDDKEKSQEEVGEEINKLDTTAPAELKGIQEDIITWLDVLFQKECTNQKAKANFVVDGKTIAEDVPATYFLAIESRLKKIKEAISAMPTLQSGIDWEKAEDLGDDIWRTKNPDKSDKTMKTYVSKEMSPATKEHPAQIKEWAENIKVGMFSTIKYSGAITIADKNAMLARCNKMQIALKECRQEANRTEVDTRKVGKEIMSFITGS